MAVAPKRIKHLSDNLLAMPRARHDHCFPPISRKDAETLILGSLPGRRSLEMQQYYAHPQNAFWKLITAIFEADANLTYEQRARLLKKNRIALWDVLAGAERPGSLDSSIVHASAEANDFREFFRKHAKVRRVFFNGRKSEEIFRRRVLPLLGPDFPDIQFGSLPSTSPAHAGMTFAKKLAQWRSIRSSR
jgi:double-stranded uracil-DNA glycosylase